MVPITPMLDLTFQLLFFFGLGVDLLDQIDVVGIVKLIPIGNAGDRAAAALGEGGEDSLAKLRIENFADADHAHAF